MKFREIFCFEFVYQARRLSTWLFFTALMVVAILFVRGNFLADAMYADFYINSPFVIVVVTVFCSLFWLLVAAAITGEISARDAGTGMHPLTYTSPVKKYEYLGGRFLAALVLNALILLAVPAGILLSVYSPGVDTQVIGPFRPMAYITAYGFIALPNAFLGTAIQFAWATLGRRAILSYIGGVLLLFGAYGGVFSTFYFGAKQEWAVLFDFFGQLTILDITFDWTPLEKSTRLIQLNGSLLWSRLLWFGIALGALTFTYFRFRFTHPTTSSWLDRIFKRREVSSPSEAYGGQATPSEAYGGQATRSEAYGGRTTPSKPYGGQVFNASTYALQTITIARASFWKIAKSPGGLPLLVIISALTVLIMPQHLENMGTPLMPRTEFLLTFLTAQVANPLTPWVIIPLLILLYAGELVWREREAGLGEITDAAPIPDWVLFLGKFIGLGLLLIVWISLLMIAGITIQLRQGYYHFEIELYLQVLFGLQFPELLLFALLALTIQGLVTQKYVGHFVALLAYVFIAFAGMLGINHHLLVYGSAPKWQYTDMRGFGPTLGPWIWFMFYWIAWAILLAVLAKLLWMRGSERKLRTRIRLARNRFSRSTAGVAAITGGFIFILGGFIFYNTNVLNEYSSASRFLERRADYERRYARFAASPQPDLTSTNLKIELHPRRGEVDIHGTYNLLNRTGTPIDTIHIALVRSVQNGVIEFNQKSKLAISDDDHGHRTYILEEPLQPGDSLQLSFEVHVEQHGFSNRGIHTSVTANSTYFKNEDWLPAIGYKANRELRKAGERRAHGLVPRPLIPALGDTEVGDDVTGEGHQNQEGRDLIGFETIMVTDEDQVAVAPGVLQKTWLDGGRRYFHYATDLPIGNEWRFFSARYAVHEEQWNPGSTSGISHHPVAIQIYHHPQHAAQLPRMLQSVKASLDYYTREYGPYPYSYIRLVENPGSGMGMHAEAAMIDYTEGFSRFDPKQDTLGLDLPFAVVAHEMAHQWWGVQLPAAPVEGIGLLTESPAWYSAMGVVESFYGRDHLRRLLRFFRQPYPIPPIRQSVPLLRGADPYAAYRKGPFALYGLSEYIGKEKVNLAYRRLLEKHRSGIPPLPTSLDLYRELKSVTPDSIQYLLHDYFEANTFWELEAEKTSSRQLDSTTWEVTLDLKARKVTVDPSGAETVIPMDEWIEIGVFGRTGESREFGETLYIEKHRIRSGLQTIKVKVSGEPSDAGIDPFHLLIDLEPFDNVERVKLLK